MNKKEMNSKYVMLFSVVCVLLFTSCVSKKKFTEMQAMRMKAEEQVRQLTGENDARAKRIETMIADFEAMKNELMESNVLKDQLVDNLNKEIAGLNEQLNEQQQSLQESSFNYGFERDRLSETLQERENSVRALEQKIAQMEKEMSSQNSALSDRNVRINALNDQMASMEREKEQEKKQQAALEQKLLRMNDEVNALKAQIAEKDEAITRLQNNVNLLKRELGGGN